MLSQKGSGSDRGAGKEGGRSFWAEGAVGCPPSDIILSPYLQSRGSWAPENAEAQRSEAMAQQSSYALEAVGG